MRADCIIFQVSAPSLQFENFAGQKFCDRCICATAKSWDASRNVSWKAEDVRRLCKEKFRSMTTEGGNQCADTKNNWKKEYVEGQGIFDRIGDT
jgi:hypothetical protein